jgi:tRNA (adenine22-N1)-methyltransferase
VAALVPRGSRVADVGTGDARLPRRLSACGRTTWCVATERKPQAEGRDDVELRAGDGLGPLEREDRIDVLILAGMGARKMIRILGGGGLERIGARRLVLQPQCEAERLRGWLAGRGFSVVAEQVTVERGRRYVVLALELC